MTTDPRTARPAAIALAGALSLAAAMGIGRFAFTPLLPLMVREHLLDVGLGGWLAAANYVGYLLGALTAARVPLRAGALALVALAAVAASTAAMAWPSPLLWLVMRGVAGIASAWVFVGTSGWCLGALARQSAGRLGGRVYAGVGGGIALAGLHGWLAAAAGLPSPTLWLQLAGLAALLALPAAWVMTRLPQDLPTRPSAPATPTAPAPERLPASRPGDGLAGLVACYGAMGFGYILPATFLPVLARNVVDDPRVFGLAWPVFGAMAALSTLLGARLLRSDRRIRTWAACQALMGLGALLPALWAGVGAIVLSALLVGGTFMVITLAGVQEVRERAPHEAVRLVGRITAAFAIGQIAGPVLSTLLVRLTPHGLALALGAGALALFVSAAWLWRAASPPPTPSPERTAHA